MAEVMAGEGSPDRPEKLLKVREVAEMLGVSRETVFGLLRTGRLRSVLVGQRGRRVTPAQLQAYIASLEHVEPDPHPE
jgi:excisionase family DNA binding protein